MDTTTGGKKLAPGYQKCSRWPEVLPSWSSTTTCARQSRADGASDDPYPTGFCAICPKVDAEYLQQLCAEQLVIWRDRNSFAAIREWQKMRERNEALDCYVYAGRAALRPRSLRGSPLAKSGKATFGMVTTVIP